MSSNVSNKSYHEKRAYSLSAQHKEEPVSVAWENVVSGHGSSTALNEESLGKLFWFHLVLLIILFLPNVLKKSYHVTGSDQFYAQHKGRMVGVAWENVVLVYGASGP